MDETRAYDPDPRKQLAGDPRTNGNYFPDRANQAQARTLGGGLDIAKSAPHRPGVMSMLDHEGSLLGDLHDELMQLEGQLRPVLECPPPAAGSGTACKIDESSATDRIAMHNDAITSLLDRVRALRARLQL